MTLPELGLTAAPGHGGLPAMVQRREWSMGCPSQASPGAAGGVATRRRWWRCSVRAAHGRGEMRRRTGRGAVEDGEASAALTQAVESVR
jgi:hypothetical protein